MTTHTPGPWILTCNDKDFLIESPEGISAKLLATLPVHRLGSGDRVPQLSEQTANARLIAAAPELLRVLERITDIYEKTGPMPSAIASEARADIAKARGGA